MNSDYILYSSIWCPLDNIRDCIKNGRQLLKSLIEQLRDFGDNDGITFLELTEDSLRNLPVFMVKNMECFTRDNIDTMVFNIKEIKVLEEHVASLIKCFEDCFSNINCIGFKSEVVIIREDRREEENIGKTVRKKDYGVYYHRHFE